MRITASVLVALLLAGCGDGNVQQALGTLERDRIVLKATANEIIVEQPVPEGTVVTAGTLLVQLDDRRQQAVVSGAKAELGRAEAHLEELRNGARPEDIAASSARVAEALPAQYIAELLPATHYIRLIRGVFLRGAQVQQLLPDTLWLIGFTLIMLGIATKRFRKSLD